HPAVGERRGAPQDLPRRLHPGRAPARRRGRRALAPRRRTTGRRGDPRPAPVGAALAPRPPPLPLPLSRRERRSYNGRMTDPAHRAGHVAVIGRPNVGKSTLVNALVGAKVSIVSNRPQTTRHRLLGIATFPQGQLVLVDTPGLHRGLGTSTASAMHRWMNRAARGALEGVDAALLVVEAGRWDDEDTLAYEALREAGVPVVLAVNQVDRIKDKAALLPYLGEATRERSFASVHPISALKRQGLESLVASLLELLPEQPPLYGEDEITDKSQRFLAGELLREQPMRQLGAELPYATTVEVESFAEDPGRHGPLYRIGAVIWVERDGQKAIVIGKGGARLREIG